jgi:DNA-binding XRE family transcriptional regulator
MRRRLRDARQLGQAVSDLRKLRGMTQEELAEWLSVDRTTVVRLEAGRLSALQRLMSAFSVLGADLVVVERSAGTELAEIVPPGEQRD